jgi:hypothetical protein
MQKWLHKSMMKNRILFLIIGMVLLMGIVGAGKESLGVFKQNQDVRIVQVCDDANWVNLSSVSYPSGAVALGETEMTSVGSGEYFYLFTDTQTLGKYDVRGISDGCENTFTYYFEITEGGDIFGMSQSLLLLGQFGVIALFFGIGMTFGREKWKLRNFFFMCSLLMGVIFLNSIRVVVGTSTSLSSMGNIGLILGIIVLSFMFLYLLIAYTIEVFGYFKNKSDMRWSVNPQ